MNEKTIASNLKKPVGPEGIQIGDFMAKGNLSFYNNILSVVNFKSTDKVLEIGMGNGKHIHNLFKNGLQEYIGLDYSETMIDEAIKNTSTLNYVKFIEADAHNIPLLKNTIDVIFTINTLYFYENPDQVLQQIKNTLKNDGTFILGKRTFEDLQNLSAITQYGFNNYKEEEVKEMLVKSGFEITNHITFAEPESHANNQEFNLNNEFYVCKPI
jgi:ubiquinone/menaquinone biosynthesis C-methylase UbiE